MTWYVVSERNEHPWFRFFLVPAIYLSWDPKDRTLAIGVELWGTYAELCFTLDDEED